MMTDNTPLIVIEVVLVFGGALAFTWWQFREIRRDREKAAAKRRTEADAGRDAAADDPRL